MNDRTTLVTELNVFADFKPQLPDSYRAEPYLLLGNIQPALQRSVRGQMNGVRYVGGDTMNYWIHDYRDELLSTKGVLHGEITFTSGEGAFNRWR